jgi:hypothetical protein
MKIIYEFDPYEDKYELEVFQKASSNAYKLNEIENYIRKFKHDDRKNISIDELKESIYSILGDENN